MVSRIKRHTALQLRIVRQVPRARGDAPQALALRLVVRIRSASAQTSCSLRYAILSPHPNAHTRGALPFRLPLLVGPLSLVSGPRFCPLLEVPPRASAPAQMATHMPSGATAQIPPQMSAQQRAIMQSMQKAHSWDFDPSAVAVGPELARGSFGTIYKVRVWGDRGGCGVAER